MTLDQAEQTTALSIGSIIGGRTPGNQAWRDELTHLTRNVVAASAGVEAPLKLNVVFHVSGHLLQPDFEGVRTGVFSKADELLMIQVALAATNPADPRAELLTLLRSAVDEAEAWAARRRVAFEREPFVHILELVARP